MKSSPIVPKSLVSFPEIPQGLALIAQGRDNILTHELGIVTNIATQTIRQHLSKTGTFHGIKPIRIGGRLQFSVVDIAKLLRGESL
jgi:hypothetical protein